MFLSLSEIEELAKKFRDFTMTYCENNFMMVNVEELEGNAWIFFIASLFIMVLFIFFASDSFDISDVTGEVLEMFSKVSVIKVFIFSATVYSVHTFYKMLVALVGEVIAIDASISALECLGSYINPLSIMIYAYTVATMDLDREKIQATFLGWTIFLTPAIMSFYGFKKEHIAIYSVAIIIGIAGGILYSELSPYITCFILYIIYFIAKYFMILHSGQIQLLTETTFWGKICQYFACIQMDLILALIMLLILFIYRIVITKNVKLNSEVIYVAIFAIMIIISSFCQYIGVA